MVDTQLYGYCLGLLTGFLDRNNETLFRAKMNALSEYVQKKVVDDALPRKYS